jgi:hypothetical protein
MKVKMPTALSADATTAAARDLIQALENPSPASPLRSRPLVTVNAPLYNNCQTSLRTSQTPMSQQLTLSPRLFHQPTLSPHLFH